MLPKTCPETFVASQEKALAGAKYKEPESQHLQLDEIQTSESISTQQQETNLTFEEKVEVDELMVVQEKVLNIEHEYSTSQQVKTQLDKQKPSLASVTKVAAPDKNLEERPKPPNVIETRLSKELRASVKTPTLGQIQTSSNEKSPTPKSSKFEILSETKGVSEKKEYCDEVVESVVEPRLEEITLTTSEVFLQNYSNESSVIAADIPRTNKNDLQETPTKSTEVSKILPHTDASEQVTSNPEICSAKADRLPQVEKIALCDDICTVTPQYEKEIVLKPSDRFHSNFGVGQSVIVPDNSYVKTPAFFEASMVIKGQLRSAKSNYSELRGKTFEQFTDVKNISTSKVQSLLSPFETHESLEITLSEHSKLSHGINCSDEAQTQHLRENKLQARKRHLTVIDVDSDLPVKRRHLNSKIGKYNPSASLDQSCPDQKMDIESVPRLSSTQAMEIDNVEHFSTTFNLCFNRIQPACSPSIGQYLCEHMELDDSSNRQALPFLFNTSQSSSRPTFSCQSFGLTASNSCQTTRKFNFRLNQNNSKQSCFSKSTTENILQTVAPVERMNQTGFQGFRFSGSPKTQGLARGVFNQTNNQAQEITFGNIPTPLFLGSSNQTCNVFGNQAGQNNNTLFGSTFNQINPPENVGDTLNTPPSTLFTSIRNQPLTFSNSSRRNNHASPMSGISFNRYNPPEEVNSLFIGGLNKQPSDVFDVQNLFGKNNCSHQRLFCNPRSQGTFRDLPCSVGQNLNDQPMEENVPSQPLVLNSFSMVPRQRTKSNIAMSNKATQTKLSLKQSLSLLLENGTTRDKIFASVSSCSTLSVSGSINNCSLEDNFEILDDFTTMIDMFTTLSIAVNNPLFRWTLK